MSDDYDSNLANANFWAQKAVTANEDARLAHNKNRAESIHDGQTIRKLNAEVDSLRAQLADARGALKLYEDHIDSLNKNGFLTTAQVDELLSKPLNEIANGHAAFEANFRKNQLALAEWMVSQRAFKELAIENGLRLGISKETTLSLGLNETPVRVLSNETKHVSAADIPFAQPYLPELLKSALARLHSV